jgi:cytochrome c biogenesis protein
VKAIELKDNKGTRPLDFSVRCDRFWVDFYENGSPKTYRSDLSFIRDGRVIQKGAALVNHPITFENLRFYQSSYERSPNNKAALSYSRGGVKKEIGVAKGDVFELAADNATADVLRVEENMMEMGPAVKLRIHATQGHVDFWVFKHLEEIKAMNPMLLASMPLFDPGRFKPYVFRLNGVDNKYRTGLQVVSDPGLPMIFTGGFLMLAGLLIVFFMSHFRIWIGIDRAQGKTRIRIADRSAGKKWITERDIRLLLSHLRQEIK